MDQQRPAKAARRRIDGVLLLDKPTGISSNGALQAAKRLFAAAKAGHTGTLDPLATGLLPLCFGDATKFSQTLLDADKAYEATLRLGVSTDSGDSEGRVLERRPVGGSADDLARVIGRFVGEIEQTPPMHSALKRDGVPLYVLARKGIEVERAARRVVIAELRGESIEEDRVWLSVRCSKGTYIRVLAHDIGEALGCGAHLETLRRTAIGPFEISRSTTLAALEACTQAERDRLLLPVDALLGTLPCLDLDAERMRDFCRGQPVGVALPPGDGPWRVYARSGFVGLGVRTPDGRLAPRRLCATPETPPESIGNA